MKKLIRVLLAPPDEGVVHVDEASLKAGVVAFSKDRSEMFHVVVGSTVKKNNCNDEFTAPMCDTLAELIKEDTDYDYYQLNGLEKPKRIVLNNQDEGEWVLFDDVVKDPCVFLIKRNAKKPFEVVYLRQNAFYSIKDGAEVYLITEA